MNNADFWTEIKSIIKGGFDTKGLQKLDYYAELFVRGKLVFKRFSPTEQYGCTKGGSTNVIATLLAGAKNQADTDVEGNVGGVKDDFQLGAQQEKIRPNCVRAVSGRLQMKCCLIYRFHSFTQPSDEKFGRFFYLFLQK